MSSPIGLWNTNTAVNDVGTAARFVRPYRLVLTPDRQTMYVGDSGGIRKIDLSTYTVSSFAGGLGASLTSIDGTLGANTIAFDISAITTDGANLYWLEQNGWNVPIGMLLRKADFATGTVTTLKVFPNGVNVDGSFASAGIAATDILSLNFSRSMLYLFDQATVRRIYQQ